MADVSLETNGAQTNSSILVTEKELKAGIRATVGKDGNFVLSVDTKLWTSRVVKKVFNKTMDGIQAIRLCGPIMDIHAFVDEHFRQINVT